MNKDQFIQLVSLVLDDAWGVNENAYAFIMKLARENNCVDILQNVDSQYDDNSMTNRYYIFPF